jgi:integrase
LKGRNVIHSATFKALLGANPEVKRKDGSVRPVGEVFDGGGLVLLVGTGRQRSWEFRFRFEGKACTLGLGSAHKVDLKDARDKAAAAAKLVAAGEDPRKVKADAKAERLAEARKGPELSFHECAAKAVLNPAVCKVTGEEAQAKWVASMAPHRTANITAKSPREITREDVVTAIESIRVRGKLTTANKVLRRMATVFEWCAGHDLIPMDAPNPAVFTGRQRIRLPHIEAPEAHHAMIPWRAAPAVGAGLRAHERRLTALANEWILLSAVRLANGTDARRDCIDRVAKVWTIPASEMKEDGHGAHRVPLTDRHLEILDELATITGDTSEFLFPGRSDGRLSGNALRTTLREVYPHLITRKDGSTRKASIHGLRAAFRTWGDNQLTAVGGKKYDEETLELCLAHVVGDSARNAYVQENNVEIRRAIMTDWAAFLASDSNVVAFPVAA